MRALAYSLIAVLLCATNCYAEDPKPPANLSMGADEGIILIGIPAQASVTFRSGVVAAGRFVADGWSNDEFVATPIGGTEHESTFVVIKVKVQAAGKGYAPTVYKLAKTIESYCGEKVPVLLVKPGKVQYYGMFSLVMTRRIVDGNDTPAVSITQAYDLNAGKAYLKSKYPDENAELIEGELQGLRFGKDCS
jgi:hypothetical protein